MSADDFQTKYASVMESMLKSAIAETTKLFENMVDELKAEISQIKKENADLKSKCFQYEVEKSQPVDRAEESDSQPGQSDDSGKCDSGIQCDLVPYRTVLVEECQPLVESPQQNQEQQSTHDSVGYTWQDHNYVSNGCRGPKIVHVKQESSLKQEEEESDLISEQVLSKTGASVSVECEESRISKGSSVEQIPSQKRDATQMVLQLPCFGTDSSHEVAQNQPSGLNHSLVISLTDAFREDIKEENEVYQMTPKMGTSEDLRSQKQQLVPEGYHLDKASLLDEQTEGTVKQHGDVACTTNQFAESELIRKEVVDEEVKGNVEDDVANTNPARRRRGRPPKKRNAKQNLPKTQKKVGAQAAVNASPSEPSEASASEVLETCSSFSPPGKWNANTPAMEEKSKTHSSPPKQPPLKSSQLFLEVEKERTEVRVFRASSASKTTNPPQSESPQASSDLLNERQSSVSLQDAMLLIEAMNQSTLENTFSLTQVPSQPQTHVPLAGPTESLAVQQRPLVKIHHATDTLDVSSNMTGTGLSNDTVLQNEETAPKQPQLVPILNNATLPVLSALSPTAATQTVIQSLPLPRLKVGSPTNVPRTIIILPRPALSFSSLNTSDASKTQSSTVDATASHMVLTAPPSPGLELSCEKPSHSFNTPTTIKVTYRKLDPVSPIQSTTILADHHLMISANKKLTIVPKSFLAAKQGIVEQEAPVSDPVPEATVGNPEPETPVNILELEVPIYAPESEATADNPEPEATADNPEPEATADNPEPEATADNPEPEATVNTLEPETPVDALKLKATDSTLEPETPFDTLEPEAPVYTPEPDALVSTPESEAPVNTLEPEAHVDIPKPKAHVDSPESEAHTNTSEPEVSAHASEPEGFVDSPEPEAHIDTPEPETHFDTPESEAHVDTPEPEAHADTPEPEAHVDTPEPEAHVDIPKPKAHVDSPESEAHTNTSEPEVSAHASEPEGFVDSPEPEAHIDTPEPG
ncbi:protein P200, partial [Austrofundulus limnaeus]|uniref:Protein P200 n=1 Tax=Austrofundulus limnaeus TaxID=52670 RepID=A0A2I4BD67_AUSLI